jgi:hypothetical protein
MLVVHIMAIITITYLIISMQNLDKSNDSQMIQTNLILTVLIVDNNDYCHHTRPRIDGEIIEASPTPIIICI